MTKFVKSPFTLYKQIHVKDTKQHTMNIIDYSSHMHFKYQSAMNKLKSLFAIYNLHPTKSIAQSAQLKKPINTEKVWKIVRNRNFSWSS